MIEKEGITTFKHFMAYKGALMVNDDEMYASFRRLAELGGIALVHAENGDVVAELSAKLLREGNTGPGRMPIPARRAGRGRRPRTPRDHDRRHGRRAACVVHTSCEGGA